MSNITLDIPIKKTISVATIPFFLKGALFLTEKLLSTNQSQAPQSQISWIGKLNQIFFIIFSDCVTFIIFMLIFTLFVNLIKNSLYKLHQRDLCPLLNTFKVNQTFSLKTKQALFSIAKFAACYAVIYGGYQLASLLVVKNPQQKKDSPPFNHHHQQHYLSEDRLHDRNLEERRETLYEEEESSDQLTVPLASNSNLVEIIGTFHAEYEWTTRGFPIISKDGKTLFLVTETQLTIFDISNLKKREIKGQVSLKIKSLWTNVVLRLSSDEQTLFSGSDDGLLIIDVSNHSSPIQTFRKDYSGSLIGCPMVLSSNGKMLYLVASFYLEIYNVSDNKNPVLLSRQISGAATIAISHDDSEILLGIPLKGFDILDVKNPQNPIVRCSCEKDVGDLISIAFSSEKNKVFISGVNRDSQRLSLQVYDVTNFASPFLLSSKVLGEISPLLRNPLWFDNSHEFAFFYLKNEFKIIKISELKDATLLDNVVGLDCTFTASADFQRSIVFCGQIFTVLKLEIDIPAKSFVHFKPNAFKIIDQMDPDRKLAIGLSKDEQNLFLAKVSGIENQFLSYQKMSHSSFVRFEEQPESIDITSYMTFPGLHPEVWSIITGKSLAIFTNNLQSSAPFISAINPANKENPIIFTSKTGRIDRAVTCIALTEDESILAYITISASLTLNLVTFENGAISSSMTDLTSPQNENNTELMSMKISRNNHVLFLASRSLMIYNISRKLESPPVLEASYDLNFLNIFGMAISKDETRLYIFGNTTLTNQKQLQIFDVSDIKSPKLLSSIYINQQTLESTFVVELAPDQKILYLGFTSGMLLIDVQVPTRPTVFGYNYFLNERHALTFANSGNLFYTASLSGVTAFNITSQYILYLKNPNFKIGGSYFVPLKIMKLNKNRRFDYMSKNHKFHKVSLFMNSTSSKTYSHATLPLWITFDKERSSLIFEPRSALTLGTYQISVSLSTQIQSSDFIGLETIPTEVEAQELLLNLLHGGYINSQGYVSEDFELDRQLWIDSKYQKINKEIQTILSENSIEALAEFSVLSSLDLLSFESKPLKVSTLSKGTINLSIQLNQTKNSNFVTKSYFNLKPDISKEKSLLTLAGPLESINEALKEIIIDLNDLEVCDGIVNVTDGINPPISHSISSISKHFIENKPPIYNSQDFSIQSWVDNKQTFSTGLYSTIEFDQNLFKEHNNLTLQYSLELPLGSESPDHHLPSWISLKGLSLIGTPPEQISPRHYDFVLVARNEFKETKVPFTLTIQISFNYKVKLVSTCIGYLASLVGFLFTFNKIYNILARRYYKYPRSYKLKLDQEITDNKIFPISFIAREIQESKKILRLDEFTKSSNFIDSNTKILDKEKITTALQNLNNPYYNSADSFSREVLQQLVVNKIVKSKLKEDKATRNIFNKIKDQWMDLVTVSALSPSQFIINTAKLEKNISKLDCFSSDDETDSSRTSSQLLIKDQYSMDLLENAILAHAFSFQNLDMNTIDIDVVSHKKLQATTLWKRVNSFLLRDLKPFVFLNKREIGYGMKYVMKEKTLHFVGKLIYDLKDDLIVVHVQTRRGRVLRQIEITGENRNQSFIESVSEKL